MDGIKAQKAMGYKPFKVGNEEYKTSLYINDITDYIKYVKNNGIRITLASSDKDVDKLESISDDMLEYKIKFVKQALINGGLDKDKAEEVVRMNIRSVIKEGNIELWLELITQKEIDEKDKTKN